MKKAIATLIFCGASLEAQAHGFHAPVLSGQIPAHFLAHFIPAAIPVVLALAGLWAFVRWMKA